MTIVDVLQLKYPGARPVLDYNVADIGNGQFIQTWNLPEPIPTQEQLNQWKTELDLAYRQKLAVSRRVYPSVGEQLDMMYKDKLNGTNIWVETITAIKDANPKPTK